MTRKGKKINFYWTKIEQKFRENEIKNFVESTWKFVKILNEIHSDSFVHFRKFRPTKISLETLSVLHCTTLVYNIYCTQLFCIYCMYCTVEMGIVFVNEWNISNWTIIMNEWFYWTKIHSQRTILMNKRFSWTTDFNEQTSLLNKQFCWTNNFAEFSILKWTK